MCTIERIHHLSATVGNPLENYRFYRDVLKLRLVKKTVNFEEKNTYHLYFSNNQVDSRPIMTFFPLDNDLYGRVGGGQVRTIGFFIPKSSINDWKAQLKMHDVDFVEELFNHQRALTFKDPHNLSIALIESKNISSDIKIIEFYGVELLSTHPKQTLNVLKDEMGLILKETSENFYHLEMSGHEKHQILVRKESQNRGHLGIVTVHHIAWSVPDVENLSSWKKRLEDKRHVSNIEDRKYFKSIYTRDPGRIIYEFATEGPGFMVDELFEELGTKLMLPNHYENERSSIEMSLPKLE